MEKIEEAMEQLEYSKKWLEYGLIDEGDVCKQYEIFLESEDKNTEHYRYSSFMRLLKREIIFYTKIKHYIELARVDKDQIMATSAIVELICSKFLTEEQFISLLVYIPINNPVLEKVYKREKLLRCLSNSKNEI